MNKIILTIGSKTDPHIEIVKNKAEEKGATFLIIDPFSSDLDSHISISINNNSSVRLLGKEFNIQGSEVTAVWWRLKPCSNSNISLEQLQTELFIQREWLHLLEPLEELLSSSTLIWMNRRSIDRKITHKPTQLYLAYKFGLEVPISLVTNDSNQIDHFLSQFQDEGIYKPLTWFFDPPNKLLFTNKISREKIKEKQNSITIAPGIYQPLIQKLYELRVTIVGSDVHCVKIESQSNPKSSLDWRREQLEINYFLHKLPAEIESKLISFHQSLGLVYGAYDFIVTPHLEHIFLEVNPVGQWLWIEEKTEIRISDSIVKTLMGE